MRVDDTKNYKRDNPVSMTRRIQNTECQKRFNKLKNINISKTSWQNDFYYTRVPGFSGIGRTREGTRLQDHIYALC